MGDDSYASYEPIAVIGMACRFPGAGNPQALWELLAHGVDAISEVPPDRWNADAFYDPDRNARGKTVSRMGGFVENLDKFDAFFFDISPREAPHVDPRQRLALETSWEALEDAGISPESLSGSSEVGVFIGTLSDEYGSQLYDDFDLVEIYTGTGSANAAVSNRVSYFLNLHGPSVTVDGACSGALLAIHTACQSLHSRECNLALAGGVNIILEPYTHIFMSHAGALSPGKQCRVFDKNADGTIRSEGMGMLLLKPLERALADGNRVLAVIIGSAINHCGRSGGIMAPNGEAQAMVLRRAYQRAGISPGQVQFIEAHGTGTRLGDPVEVNALGEVLKDHMNGDDICALGSMKANIGHAEAACGVAGAIKIVLAMQHRLLPPNIHFDEPNPLIPFERLPIRVQQRLGPWPRPSDRLIAGVSAFGFTGANAHVVLAEVPPRPDNGPAKLPYTPSAYMLPLSAKSKEALLALTQAYHKFFVEEKEPSELYDVCFTAGAGRTHFTYRLAAVAASRSELAEQLAAFLHGDHPPGVADGNSPPGKQARIVFVFPGLGVSWSTADLALMKQEPVFQDKLKECDDLIQALAGWSLLKTLADADMGDDLHTIERSRLIVFSVQAALNELWQSWGIVPDLVAGHSLGEAAAAHAAGALNLEDALRVAYHQARLLGRVEGQGKLAWVDLPPAKARLVIAAADGLFVAGSNSPTSSLLTGDPDQLGRILQSLERRNIQGQMVEGVDFAPHSPYIDALKGELIELLRSIRPHSSRLPFFSSVTGDIADGARLDAEHWGRQLCEPFVFAEAIQAMAASEQTVFIEMSLSSVLGDSIRSALQAVGKEAIVLPSHGQDKHAVMLNALGKLYTLGCTPDWRRLYPYGRCVGGLPTYPWQRERYWIDQLTDQPVGSALQLAIKAIHRQNKLP